ncbi:metallophosphoesterase [Humidisolicoccus flavus]|uniref:metallophosphoesterase n=1 Tax=Humidisolicoccus flavus TaxID=3111414 RepID=UPI00324AC678
MAPWQEDKQEWVRSLKWVEPDLIVNTGDSLGHEKALDAVRYAFEVFSGVPGVYVHGSNDYYGPVFKNPLGYLIPSLAGSKKAKQLDVEALEDLYEEFGWLSLNNTARAVEIKGNRLEFFGVNDAHRNWDRLDLLPGAIEAMREYVGWTTPEAAPGVTSFGVTHSPYQRILNSFVNSGADVIFAGHTHGGQIRVPGGHAIVTNCDIPREQASGLSRWTNAGRQSWLNVSQGIGTAITAPARLGTPPEAVVITLEARDSA